MKRLLLGLLVALVSASAPRALPSTPRALPSTPRALPWAIVLRPFGAENNRPEGA